MQELYFNKMIVTDYKQLPTIYQPLIEPTYMQHILIWKNDLI